MDVFGESSQRDAIIWKDQAYPYSWLRERVLYWQEQICNREIPHGSIVILEADFSPNAVALFLALIEARCILVPLTRSVEMKKKEFIEIAQGEIQFSIDDFDVTTISVLENKASHSLYEKIHSLDHPGLILFSSGSTGKSKAALHDLTGLLEKFKTHRFAQRSISFLLYDHIGGVNTMLHILSNGGTLITVQDRSPDAVLGAVEKYQAELLPTSPTFINLILLSEAYKRHDLSSLKTVTYGTEPMPESTLKRFHELFPEIKLQQTYGLSEVGILRSKSLGSDTLWVKIGGEGFETRVVDNILQIRAQSAMLGYLNAPNPFTDDGWFITGDEVEVDGEYMRILGRRSELINVGGEKVYPAEVESVIQAIPNVEEVSVYGEKNPITGSMVCAMVKLQQPEDEQQVKLRIKQACAANLPRYKVPVRITFTQDEQHSERFKKMRPR
jgi:acyl-CoA synthetase (AMP-forming)/AMP-acid ligase II